MADIFSTVAAGIGLVGLSISSSAKLISLIRAWRQAPALILALTNETADLQVILKRFHEGGQIIQRQLGSSDRLCAILEMEFEKIGGLLKELDSLVGDLKRGHSISRRRKWMMLEPRALKLQSQMRAARININDLLVTHLVASTNRVELGLQDIVFGIQRSQNATTANLDEANQQLRGVDAYLVALQAFISNRTLKQTSVEPNDEAPAPEPNRNIDPEVPSPKGSNQSVSEQTQPDAEPMTVTLRRPQSPCTSLCPCDCHKQANTGLRWTFRSILGTLFVGYCGFPVNLSACNVLSCEKRKAYHLTATYVFPFWLVRREIYIVLSNMSGYGPSFGVTFKRRVPGDKSKLITAALTADFDVINRIIRTEHASLTDIDYEFGWTALHWAASSGSNPALSKLLINAGMDTDLKDDSGLSAREIVVFRTLTKFEAGPHLGEFESIFDISTSYLDEVGVTSLHRTALGITSADLRGLSNMPSPSRLMQINQQDNLGWAPLHWAIQGNNITAVKDLIQAGADVNYPVTLTGGLLFSWVIHATYVGEFAFKLLDAGVDMDVIRQLHGWQTLKSAPNKVRPQLVYEILARGAYGAPLDSICCPPMVLAAYWGNAEAVQCLIDAGAEVNAVSTVGENALGVSVVLGRPECFRVLYRNGFDYRLVNGAGESILHTAARSPRVEMINCLADTWMPGLDLNARSEVGLTALQYLALQDTSQEVKDAFLRLQKAVEAANRQQAELYEDDSDQDVFFNAMTD
ncbi:ankyrin [Hypoxylon sp. FL1857]|nr:ankyrin [Hypoxylon sp. FL1857]